MLEAAADGEGPSEVAAVLAEGDLRPVEVEVAADHVAFAESFAVVVELKSRHQKIANGHGTQ